jgi:hypothetical protein
MRTRRRSTRRGDHVRYESLVVRYPPRRHPTPHKRFLRVNRVAHLPSPALPPPLTSPAVVRRHLVIRPLLVIHPSPGGMIIVRVAVVRHPPTARVYDGEEDVHECKDHTCYGKDVGYLFYSVMEQILVLLLIVIVVVVANLFSGYAENGT